MPRGLRINIGLGKLRCTMFYGLLLTPGRYFTRAPSNQSGSCLHVHLWVYISGISRGDNLVDTYSYVQFSSASGASCLTSHSFNTVCWSSGESLFSCSRPLSSCNTSVSSSQLAHVTSHFGQYRFSCIPTLCIMSRSHSCRSSLVPRGRRSGIRPLLKATASTYLR